MGKPSHGHAPHEESPAQRHTSPSEATSDQVQVSEQVRLTGRGQALAKRQRLGPAARFLGTRRPQCGRWHLLPAFQRKRTQKEHPDDPLEKRTHLPTAPRAGQGGPEGRRGVGAGQGGGCADGSTQPSVRLPVQQVPENGAVTVRCTRTLLPWVTCDCSGKRHPTEDFP